MDTDLIRDMPRMVNEAAKRQSIGAGGYEYTYEYGGDMVTLTAARPDGERFVAWFPEWRGEGKVATYITGHGANLAVPEGVALEDLRIFLGLQAL